MPFTTHSHNLQAGVHTRGSLYFVFSQEWNNKAVRSLDTRLSHDTLTGPGGVGRRGVKKGLSDPSQSIRKKISRPAHISTPNLPATLTRLLSPKLFLHLLVSPLSLF